MANGLTFKRTLNTEEDMRQLAATLAPRLREGDVIILEGDLGAGKTHFVQGVAAALGITEDVVSPTFNILLVYKSGSLPLYHFDLYRLEDRDELEDIGFYDVLDSDGATFIEWGDKFPGILPYGYLEIEFRTNDDESRTVIAHSYGERARQLLFLWGKDPEARLKKTEKRPQFIDTATGLPKNLSDEAEEAEDYEEDEDTSLLDDLRG